MNSIVISWLLDAATWLALALWLACVAYGVALVLLPTGTLRVSEQLNRRYSMRRATRSLEIPRTMEPVIYRHHRLVGGLLLAGVVIFFLSWFLGFPRDTLLMKLAQLGGQALAGVIVDASARFLLIANALIGVLAVVIIARPSLLKPLEARANRWLSTRQAFRKMEETRQPLDGLVQRFPRWTGVLILAAAAYVGLSLTFVNM